MFQEINELLLIKVIYFSKSGIISEHIFSEEIVFGDIIQYFNSNLKTEFLEVKKIYSFNGIIINENTFIKDLIEIPKGKPNIIEIKIEINEKEILDDESEPIISKIIKPKFYPFSLFVYLPKEGKITLEEYTSNIVKEFNLKKISSGSSYCNSPNSFFISGGGIYYKNAINDFWIINKEDYSIELKKMPFPRRDHSMIYLPNQTVLIAGGDDAKCFIFDIQKKIFLNYADLNGIYNKPSLLNFNNYIYCFSKLTKEKNYFERTNISNKYPVWEKIFPKFSKNVYLINKKIFFVSKCVNNSIIIGAGDNIKLSKLYIYNLTNNEISILDDKPEIEELDNKTFDKVSKFYNIGIPRYFDRERIILILNKKKKLIKKIYFSDSKSINNKIKLTEEEEMPSDEGSICIEIKPLNNNNLKIEKIPNENKLNYIRRNIEEEQVNINKNCTNRNSKYNKMNNEYFNHKNGNNLIEEIFEDDEEKNEINRVNKTIQANNHHSKIHLSNQMNHRSDSNNKNNNLNNNNDEINKDLHFGENEEFFDKKEKMNDNEIEDDFQLSRIMKKGDEFDTLDKLTVTERSLLNQIGSGQKENYIKNKTSTKKKKNRLPQVKQKNLENKSLLLKNIYKIENEKDDNYKNSYYSLNNNKNEDVSIKIE